MTICNTVHQFFSRNNGSVSNCEWKHIELGAANYGTNINADSSYQAKTSNPALQFELLFQTVDILISTKGLKGTLYINDYHSDDVDYCIALTEQYLTKQHPEHKITLEPLAGDFFIIDIPKVDSIHLKNPEYFFFQKLDEKAFSNRLAYFSTQSKEGLSLITYFKSPLIHRLKETNVGCKIQTNLYTQYRHVDGNSIMRYGETFNFLVLSTKQIRRRTDKKEFMTHDMKRGNSGYNIHMFFDLSPNNHIIPPSKMPIPENCLQNFKSAK